MIKWILRGVFILVGVSIGYRFGETLGPPWTPLTGLGVGVAASLVAVVLEWFLSGRTLAVISSILFGAILGIFFTVFTEQILVLVIGPVEDQLIHVNIRVALLALFTYLAISILYQTRDKFRVVIPYVEFRREEKGIRPVVLDTSALVDGRAADFLQTGIVDGPVIVPEMVLKELHNVADSDDKSRRERGRLGMQVLDVLRHDPSLDFHIEAMESDVTKPVDQRLVEVAKSLGARLMTNDYNLNRIASIGGVDVINLNELATALKPTALPEENLVIRLVRRGEQRKQAVGFLEDGTMVVVEDGIKMLGKKVSVKVTNSITRDTGRIVFAELDS